MPSLCRGDMLCHIGLLQTAMLLLCGPPHFCAAVHADGAKEYDAHNLFGTTMAMQSNKAATEVIGKRPFFILRWAYVSLWGSLV